jgi:hypothetical protein
VEHVLVKLLATVLFGTLPVVILFASGPPRHGSWWYPNPERWDYALKLRLYPILDANTPPQPAARWFVRVIAFAVLVGTLACIWCQRSCR